MNRTDATDCMVTWKGEAYRDYAVALVRAAANANGACVAFGSDIVPDEAVPVDAPGIPGSVCHALCTAHVMRPVMVQSPFGPVHVERKSMRDSRNGAKVKLYVLNAPQAVEFLRRHGVQVGQKQLEMAI